MVGVAQLVRAPVCGTGGRGFETHRPPQVAFVAQLDRATDFGSVGCGFDSYRAHHTLSRFFAHKVLKFRLFSLRHFEFSVKFTQKG